MKTEQVASYIETWLKDYAVTVGMKGFVIGVSGGVDSALVSTLACRTELEVLCLSLPIRQAEGHLKRAMEHLAWLSEHFTRLKTKTIELSEAFASLERILSSSGGENMIDLAFANTRSRLRMLALYHEAAIAGGLVLGTGNRVEDFGVGFFTKWGDGAADLNPIAALTKTQVKELAAYLGVSESIINAAPSDGLFDDDKTDEIQLEASYPALEQAMEDFENGKTASDFTGEKRRVFELFMERNRRNSHKMQPIPMCDIPKNLLG